jgi:hypothetical protein
MEISVTAMTARLLIDECGDNTIRSTIALDVITWSSTESEYWWARSPC